MILKEVMNEYENDINDAYNRISLVTGSNVGADDDTLIAIRADYGFSQGNVMFFKYYKGNHIEISLDVFTADKDVKHALWCLLNCIVKKKYQVNLIISVNQKEAVEAFLLAVKDKIEGACKASKS